MSIHEADNRSGADFEDWFTEEESSRSLLAKCLQSLALVIICIVCIVANGSVAWVLYKNFSIKNVPNMLLFCLTILNFFIGMVNMPFAVISTIADEWLFGNTWCELSAFMNQFLTFTSNTMVTVIALYRYQAIAKTFSAQITFRGAKWITVFAWFYSFVFSLPPFFGWNRYQFSRQKGFCTLNWKDGGSGMVYTLMVVSACFLIPLIMIIFMYVRIAVITRQNSKNVRTEPASFSSPNSSVKTHAGGSDGVTSEIRAPDKSNRIQRLSKRYLSSSKDSISESKTITSVSYVMMTYVLFLAPYYVMNIALALSQDSLSPAVDFTVAWLHYCHATAIAIVYGCFNRRIKIFLKQLPWWPKWPGCDEQQEQTFANTPYLVDQR